MAMEKFKEKLSALREEADSLIEKAEENEAKLKLAKSGQQERDQEILNLKGRVTLLQMELLKIGKRVEEHKALEQGTSGNVDDPDQLNDTINDLETRLEETKIKASETLESLRVSDIKAEHLEKNLSKFNKEINSWDSKNAELEAQLEATKKELQDTLALLDEL